MGLLLSEPTEHCTTTCKKKKSDTLSLLKTRFILSVLSHKTEAIYPDSHLPEKKAFE